jgi:hypothetical protein
LLSDGDLPDCAKVPFAEMTRWLYAALRVTVSLRLYKGRKRRRRSTPVVVAQRGVFTYCCACILAYREERTRLLARWFGANRRVWRRRRQRLLRGVSAAASVTLACCLDLGSRTSSYAAGCFAACVALAVAAAAQAASGGGGGAERCDPCGMQTFACCRLHHPAARASSHAFLPLPRYFRCSPSRGLDINACDAAGAGGRQERAAARAYSNGALRAAGSRTLNDGWMGVKQEGLVVICGGSLSIIAPSAEKRL